MELDRLFYPKKIAVVGASGRLGGGKIPFYQIVKKAGFGGPIYPVNPKYDDIDGEKCYKSLADVPEGVDLAICSVPARFALDTLRIAVEKKIGFVHFFTSGFSELGNRDLEKDLIEAARKGETRIVGPNCIGVHCAQSRVTFDFQMLDWNEDAKKAEADQSFDVKFRMDGPGDTAFLGQSGGVTSNFAVMTRARHVRLNKAVSYGNQIDIRAEDYVRYFAADENIKVIAAYIEDVKDGRAFFEVLRQTTPEKPVVILKGGSTDAGARAAASHTGAMAGRSAIWRSAMRQLRCIEVDTPEEQLDVVMMATSAKTPKGPRLGYLGAGGGTSVIFTDLAEKHGLQMPELSPRTRETISAKIPDVNTSTRNPVDLGAFGFDTRIMKHAMDAMDPDPRVDVIVPYFSLDFISLYPDELIIKGLTSFTNDAMKLEKPVVPILTKAADEKPRLEYLRLMALAIFRRAGMPVYYNLQDAIRAISAVLQWSENGKRE